MTPATVAAAPSIFRDLRLAAADIKLAHSVFAFPYAILACFLARPDSLDWARFAAALALIAACMVTARTWAMLYNRIADRRIDAANPRTQRRAVASGALATRRAWVLAAGSAALFIAFAAGFRPLLGNPWPLILAVPVLAWIAFYSLTKRFTWLCHLFLGGALAASPVAAALAIEPAALGQAWPWLLAAMVACWVAGFDIIYALQDVAFDREKGLHSAPSRLGIAPALWVSRTLHAAAAVLLIVLWRTAPALDILFLVACIIVVGLLLLEHILIIRSAERHLDMAFFTLNGLVSCLLGLAGVADVLL
jgi:4-hydroxybenzoate polyprenyltransferase